MRRLKIQGVEQHCRFNRLAGAGVRTESDLRSWMQESFPALNASLWENCRKQADEFLETGVKVFRWENSPPESPKDLAVGFSPLTVVAPLSSSLIAPKATCPAVLFGKGGLNSDLPLLAVFNSRKPRLISPDSNWLKALRFFFRSLDSRGNRPCGQHGNAHLRSGLRACPALRIASTPGRAFSPAEGGPGTVENIWGKRARHSGTFVYARHPHMFQKASPHLPRPDSWRTGKFSSRAGNPVSRKPPGGPGGNPGKITPAPVRFRTRRDQPFERRKSHPSDKILRARTRIQAPPNPGFARRKTCSTLSARQMKIHPAFLKGDRSDFTTLLSTTISPGAITSSTIPGHVPVPGRARVTINIWSICLTDIPSQATRPWKPSFGLYRKD